MIAKRYRKGPQKGPGYSRQDVISEKAKNEAGTAIYGYTNDREIGWYARAHINQVIDVHRF